MLVMPAAMSTPEVCVSFQVRKLRESQGNGVGLAGTEIICKGIRIRYNILKNNGDCLKFPTFF
jgi:hypothetical protein